ncbi:MAG: N-acetylglucosamine-6-phosphate deacetylase [Acidobacteria bacterium]|nr:N-acetylglucosamine-6-phosphate deacetylase [Acidobacteriota bacterium]
MKLSGWLAPSHNAIELQIEAGAITSLEPVATAAHWLAPGFIDMQVNGFGGVDFNDPATTTEQIAQAIRRLWATGVTHLLPTVITGSHEHLTACFANLVKAADEFPEVAYATLGFHLEGPFISTEDGPRGAHPRAHARPPDWNEFMRLQDAARGRIRLITLAPEWEGALAFIERAVAEKIIVALGHTAATPQQIRDAISVGATMSTHLGNGSHAQLARHPNYIWEQLAADELHASFIVDGHHLPPAVVKCFLRAKGVARSILVTDAIAAAGCPPGRYQFGDLTVEVTPQGRVCLPGTPYLAGSAVQMHEAIANTVKFSDATLSEAIQMATANPAALLGVSDKHGELAAGRPADVVILNETLEVVATVCGGKMVFKRIEYTL